MVRTGEHLPLPPGYEEIATKIVDAAYTVHKALGPGLLESVYEVCFCHELKKRGLSFQRQVPVPITYDGITFSEGLRLDVLVGEKIICELKTVDSLNDIHQAQLLSQMKLTGKRLGFLINFNVAVIKYGLKRMIL
jgi:GxxExxY protein